MTDVTDVTGMTDVTDADFEAEVIGADWCPPCRQVAPVLKALACEEGDRVKVVRLDVD